MPIFALIAALVLAGGGVAAAAADSAIPGDPLYGLDLAIERVQERLTAQPNLPSFALARAQERLRELETLKEKISQAQADGNFTEEERLNIWREQLVSRISNQIQSANEKIERFRELAEKTDNPNLDLRLETMIGRLESVIDSKEALLNQVQSGDFTVPEFRQEMLKQFEQLREHKGELQKRFQERKQAGETGAEGAIQPPQERWRIMPAYPEEIKGPDGESVYDPREWIKSGVVPPVSTQDGDEARTQTQTQTQLQAGR